MKVICEVSMLRSEERATILKSYSALYDKNRIEWNRIE